mmetsp:Transcript_38698/g.83729  ORF Transcript_38698/g.83729 Transcript_38698/m.83729 type:complete len:90 (+) Transcript_38698:47-316(+)
MSFGERRMSEDFRARPARWLACQCIFTAEGVRHILSRVQEADDPPAVRLHLGLYVHIGIDETGKVLDVEDEEGGLTNSFEVSSMDPPSP